MRLIISSILILNLMLAHGQISNNLNFNKAKRLMSLDSYSEALPILDSLKQAQPDNFNLDFLIGQCYFYQSFDKPKSIPYFENAVKHSDADYKNNYKSDSTPLESYYFLAHAYLLNEQFNEAIATVDQLKPLNPENDLLEQCETIKRNAENAKELMLLPIEIEIKRLDKNINSEQDDYTALINADESQMVFTSRRPGSTGHLINDEGKYYEDIYISNNENQQWSPAENISDHINTERHDACVAFSADGTQLIIYRDDYGIGNLYHSHKDSLGWSKAEKMSQNINSKANETHAAFSPDGEILYFVSDIKGGKGGKDIYYCQKLPDGTWSYPQNMNSTINTAFDEDGVFIHPDGQKLYFSSKGHNSMGGFDIFYCERIGDTTWSEPKNIGYPINTTDDDMFAVFSADGKRAYYSALKTDGMGGFDIYMINLMSLPERNQTIVKGFITASDGSRQNGKILKVKDAEGREIGKYKPNKEGLYTLVLKQGQVYDLSIGGVQLKSSKLNVPQNTAFYITQKALEIESIAEIE